MKRILALILIASLIIPGCAQSNGDKIVMTVSEYEALKEAADKEEASEQEETPTPTPTEKPTPTPTDKPLPTITPSNDDFKDGDLVGEWAGYYYKKSYEGGDEVTSEEPSDVFLAINSDGTWTAIEGGDKDSGTWEKATDSGRVLSLINVSSGESIDNGWSFGKLNGKFVYSFNDWFHYDVEMTKQ